MLTLALDAIKGAAAVGLAQLAAGDDYLTMCAAATAAVAGHSFPVFLRFRGGKGVATGLGVFLALAPYAVLGAMVVFLVVVYFTRYVSLGSMTAALSVPVFTLFFYGWLWPSSPERLTAIIVTSIVTGALIVARHHENIKRLWNGTENRLGQRVGGVDPDRPAVSGGQGR